MVREEVINLFSDVEGFEEADELVQALNARKRGCYNKKPKIYEIDPYTLISNLYSALANYLPYPLGKEEEIIITESGIRGWYTICLAEGEPPQKLFQAEIIGTENFNITDRIKLHKKLINLLQARVELKNAVKLVQQDVKELQKKYKISEYAKWLRKYKISSV